MGLEDFERCTPSEFRAIFDAWQKQAARREQGEWERTRFGCLCMLQPYSRKKLRGVDVMKFPWEDTAQKEQPPHEAMDPQEEKARYEAAKRRYGITG